MLDIIQLPKIDIHCHLDGSLPITTFVVYSRKKKKKSQICITDCCHSLTEYLTKFDIPVQCLQTYEHLENATYECILNIAKENTTYVELRFAPMLSVNQNLTCDQVLESVLSGVSKGKAKTGIDCKIITCAMRHFHLDLNMQLLDSMEKYLNKGVCALDLAGDESLFPNTLFHELFEEANHRNIPFTIHSGETGNVENIRTAVDYGAKRIGHGLALIQDPDLMQEVARKKIGVEMCPTSNLQTKAIDSFDNYPLLDFLDAGIKVSINTDNRTVSNTSMTKELQFIQNMYHDDALILQLLENAHDTKFL